MIKLLIGGQALMQLGSTRGSNDINFLINEPTNLNTFIHIVGQDLVNAAHHKFFKEIWEKELNGLKDDSPIATGEVQQIASPQSLLELKAFAFVQHCLNHNWQKADDAEYDIKFLCRKFKLTDVPICKKHISNGQYYEIKKIISNVQP